MAEVVYALQVVREGVRETLMGYTIIATMFVVSGIIILLAFQQVDMALIRVENASTKRGQITVKSCSWSNMSLNPGSIMY